MVSKPSTGPSKPAPKSQRRRAPITGLAFVSVTHPNQLKDRKTQKLISQHVMKDIGRSRRRRPRNEKILLEFKGEEPIMTRDVVQLSIIILQQHTASPQQNLDMAFSKLSSRLLPSPDADYKLHSQLISARSRQLMKFLYGEGSPMCQGFRSLFFSLAISEDSVMYLALAEAALPGEWRSRYSSPQENTDALKHYTTSMEMVKAQLENRAVLTTMMIGTIIALASYDLHVRNLTRWAVHMAGLEKIIQSMGGMEHLKSEGLRRHLIWADFVGCLLTDSPPRFALHVTFNRPPHEHQLTPVLRKTIATLRHKSPCLEEIGAFLGSLSYTANATFGKSPTEWANEESTLQILGSTVHDLLSMQRLGIYEDEHDKSTTGPALREAIRLALLVFLATTVNYLASLSLISTEHNGRLPGLLRSHRLNWSGLEDLQLWMLVTSAITETDADKAWLINQIIDIMDTRQLNWEAVLYKVRQIAWIDSVWSKEADRLGKEVEQSSSVPFFVI